MKTKQPSYLSLSLYRPPLSFPPFPPSPPSPRVCGTHIVPKVVVKVLVHQLFPGWLVALAKRYVHAAVLVKKGAAIMPPVSAQSFVPTELVRPSFPLPPTFTVGWVIILTPHNAGSWFEAPVDRIQEGRGRNV